MSHSANTRNMLHDSYFKFYYKSNSNWNTFNPLNAELIPICHLPALLGAHYIFHVSGLRVKSTAAQQQF